MYIQRFTLLCCVAVYKRAMQPKCEFYFCTCKHAIVLLYTHFRPVHRVAVNYLLTYLLTYLLKY